MYPKTENPIKIKNTQAKNLIKVGNDSFIMINNALI